MRSQPLNCLVQSIHYCGKSTWSIFIITPLMKFWSVAKGFNGLMTTLDAVVLAAPLKVAAPTNGPAKVACANKPGCAAIAPFKSVLIGVAVVGKLTENTLIPGMDVPKIWYTTIPLTVWADNAPNRAGLENTSGVDAKYWAVGYAVAPGIPCKTSDW